MVWNSTERGKPGNCTHIPHLKKKLIINTKKGSKLNLSKIKVNRIVIANSLFSLQKSC